MTDPKITAALERLTASLGFLQQAVLAIAEAHPELIPDEADEALGKMVDRYQEARRCWRSTWGVGVGIIEKQEKVMSDKITTGRPGSMSYPPTFYYANSVRVYSGAGDFVIELGRALPINSDGETPQSIGVVGVVIPAVAAVHLAKQILAQAKIVGPQMREMADEIERERGDVDVQPSA